MGTVRTLLLSTAIGLGGCSDQRAGIEGAPGTTHLRSVVAVTSGPAELLDCGETAGRITTDLAAALDLTYVASPVVLGLGTTSEALKGVVHGFACATGTVHDRGQWNAFCAIQCLL